MERSEQPAVFSPVEFLVICNYSRYLENECRYLPNHKVSISLISILAPFRIGMPLGSLTLTGCFFSGIFTIKYIVCPSSCILVKVPVTSPETFSEPLEVSPKINNPNRPTQTPIIENIRMLFSLSASNNLFIFCVEFSRIVWVHITLC